MPRCFWTFLFLACAAPAVAQFEQRFPAGSVTHLATGPGAARTITISGRARRALDPGVFSHDTTDSTVVVNENGTPNDPSHPADMDSVVTFGLTGEGRLASNNIKGVVQGPSTVRIAAKLAISSGGVQQPILRGRGNRPACRVPRISNLYGPDDFPIDLAFLASAWQKTA